LNVLFAFYSPCQWAEDFESRVVVSMPCIRRVDQSYFALNEPYFFPLTVTKNSRADCIEIWTSAVTEKYLRPLGEMRSSKQEAGTLARSTVSVATRKIDCAILVSTIGECLLASYLVLCALRSLICVAGQQLPSRSSRVASPKVAAHGGLRMRIC
jgi:hypothetical protein